jgi:hypothetical protein
MLIVFGFPGYRNSADGRFITAKALVPQCHHNSQVLLESMEIY